LVVGCFACFSMKVDWQRFGSAFEYTLLAATIGFTIVCFCQVSLSPVFHRLLLTSNRLRLALIGTPLLLPFWLGFEYLVRRGSLVRSTIFAIIGRILILFFMLLAVGFGELPGVPVLFLPTIPLVFVMMEIFAASAYSVSRNLVLIGLVEAVWFSWMIAAITPLRVM